MGKNTSLYDITEEIKALDEMLNNDQGEISETYEELNDFINDLFSKKTDGCVNYVQSLADDINSAKERINEMKSFIQYRESAIESFKKYVQLCMDKTGQEKFVGEFYSIKKRASSKVVKILDENKIPIEYLSSKTTTNIDKKAILKALKNKEIVDGCELGKGESSLKIGIKSKKD